ncbi:nuclear envelope integral membrane protein 1-like isoform X2 [Rhopilema esculentum]|uniref:nuclear envelope integral membrane protein 1-like isoform X1 n=1 Tax=Rhopilema esculentum TaxID=499914 RepID=UPI0031DCCA70
MQCTHLLTTFLLMEWITAQCNCLKQKHIFDSCKLEKNDDSNDEIYKIKGSQFGLFNIFSRLQIVINSSKKTEVNLRTSKEDLVKVLKIQQPGLLRRIFGRLIQLSNGVNTYGNTTKQECSPFIDQYLALSSDEEDNSVTVICDSQTFDPKLLGLFAIGVFLFFFAEHCSRNTAFYYASGVTISVLMSWTVIIILLLKLLPYKKSLLVMVAASGASFGLYLTQSFLMNLHFYATYHLNWLLWYTAVVSLSTLAFLYYKGPPSNERFLNLTKWMMQFLGLLLVYNSTWAKEVAVTAILTVIVVHFSLEYLDVARAIHNWIQRLSPYNRHRGPKKKRFLTEEEFREEAEKETSKALAELRGYCSSPECSPWRVVSRLKDPKRFASFMETGRMLSDHEIAEYDNYEPEEGEDSWISSDDPDVKLEEVEEESAEDGPLISDDFDDIDDKAASADFNIF